MPTVYVADRFRGSGTVHKSTPDAKHPSVSDWTIYGSGEYNPGPPSEDSYQCFKRSATGLAAQWGASTDTAAPLVRVAGDVALGSGVFIAETQFYERAQLSIRANGSAVSIVMSATAGSITWSTFGLGGASGSFSDGITRDRTVLSKLRIEIDKDLNQVRGYANDTLRFTISTAVPTTVSWFQLWWEAWGYVAERFGGASVAAEYVHAQLNTVSGPLGAPATPTTGAGAIPALVVSGGQYRRGNGAVTLQKLITDGGAAPLPPAFWDRLVRANERR